MRIIILSRINTNAYDSRSSNVTCVNRMDYEKIEVWAYSGYRGQESPRIFFLKGKRIEVLKIIDHWIEERRADKGRYRCFRVLGSDWKTHVICYDEEEMEWLYSKDKFPMPS